MIVQTYDQTTEDDEQPKNKTIAQVAITVNEMLRNSNRDLRKDLLGFRNEEDTEQSIIGKMKIKGTFTQDKLYKVEEMSN